MLIELRLLDVSMAVLQVRRVIALAVAEKEAHDLDLLEDNRDLQHVEGELECDWAALETQRTISAVDSGLPFATGTLDIGKEGKSIVATILQDRSTTRRLSGLETFFAPGDVVQVKAPVAQSELLRSMGKLRTQ